MKKVICVFVLSPFFALAQKEIKPSVSRAESALQKGAFDEAKAIIDVTVASQEFMVDKKGSPSKNAAKAWYLKGMIYAGIDTSKVEKFKSLDADPFPKAKEAFTKAEELDKGKSESLVNYVMIGQQLPMPKKQVEASFAQAFLNRGYEVYKTKDYKKAFVDIEKVLFFMPNDTTQLMNAGVYFAPAADEDEKAITYINKYIAAGGKNTDAYIQLYSVYSKKATAIKNKYKDNKDREAFLKDPEYVKHIDEALKVAKQLTAQHPTNSDYLNMEYNIYAQNNRLAEAKTLMEKRAGADAKDKESRYLLGLISNEMKDQKEARKWMEEALKIDPMYYEANLVIAKLTYTEAQNLRKERNAISGSKPADLAKRQDLYKQIPVKLKESEVYWQKCVDAKPNEEESLYGIYSLYNDISTYDEKYNEKINTLKKKMKSLGLEVD